MDEAVKVVVALVGEDSIDMSIFSKILDASKFSFKSFSYNNYQRNGFAETSIVFLFSPKNILSLVEAINYFSIGSGVKKLIILISSSGELKLLGSNEKELLTDHIVFPSDNIIVEKRLNLYRDTVLNFSNANRSKPISRENSELESRVLELEEQNVAKDKFFAIIAHDLKNPFTGFLGFSEYIAKYYDEISKEDLGDFSLRMYESAQLVYNLIENLLAWSKLRTGNMDFEPVPFDISETVERVVKLCDAMIIKKEINLVNSVNNRVSVYADANMVDTVVRNVVTNALKFTPKGGVVHISSVVEDNYLTIIVADSGVGIPEERQKKMFRLGYRVSRDGTDGESGTGLGMILSKEFMLKNGGDLYFESKENNGSKFFLKVPSC
jgi:signal transduction histidine kinase